MAGNLFYGLNISRNALIAQTNVLNVTAHNVANANTPGFSRQQVHLVSISDDAGAGLRMSSTLKVGSGVKAISVSRSRYALFDEIYRNEYQDLNFNTKTENLMNQVELMFDEPSDRSLGGIINDFFNGWQDVANSPSNTAARQSLASVGEEMSTRMQRIYNSLVIMRDDIDTEITTIPSELNEITQEIADLNIAIRKSETQTGPANDLRDKRDLLLDRLSKYVDVRAIENDDGTITVLTGSTVLVEKDTISTLSIKTTVADERGHKRTTIVTDSGIEFEPKNGELGALIDFRDTVIIDVMNSLDKLAESIVTTVNFDHRIGYGLDGLNERNFFNPDNVKAFNIEISSDIEDVNNIAASSDGSVGNTQNALNINELRNLQVVDGNFTINQFYNGIVTDLGIMAREAKSSRINKELIVNQIDNTRESIKGVSIDEEMIAMIQAQRIYQSASRLIVVMDQLLEEVINLK